MVIAGLVLAGAAALVHVFIFYLESFAWTSERTRSTFGTTAAEAEATRALAYNQGFYNLFLAIVTAVGIGCVAAGQAAVGAALVFAGAGSMAAAAIVLGLSDPTRRGAALKQGADSPAGCDRARRRPGAVVRTAVQPHQLRPRGPKEQHQYVASSQHSDPARPPPARVARPRGLPNGEGHLRRARAGPGAGRQ